MTRQWLLALVCASLAGAACADDTGAPDGVLRGEITRVVGDRADGTTEVAYALRLPDGSERPLRFDRDPDLRAYTPVTLAGRFEGVTFVVAHFAVDAADTAGARRAALVGAPVLPNKKFAFVMIDTGGGVNLTVATARQRLFDAAYFMAGQGSIRRYYREDSYGIQDITGDVYGPIAYTPGSTCDTAGVTSLRSQVDAMSGVISDHYLWYFGSRQAGCGFEGAAAEGTSDRPQRDSWYNASTSCVVLAQEPGHNFGMQHSSSMSCGGQTFVDAPNGTCRHNEYGNPFDPMGAGCRHMNGWQKAYQGWLDGCNGVKVGASGTFTLFPLETSCNGIQLLQIPMPKTRPFAHSGGGGTAATDMLTSYYVELRAPSGFDQGLAPMVLVHVAGDVRGSNTTGLHTWLLDMTPATSTRTDAALAAGQTFTDPAGGVSFTVVSASASQASIKVDMAGASSPSTCFDGTTLTAPGPSSCGTAAGGAGGGAGDAGGAGGSGGGAGGAPAGGAGGSVVDAGQPSPDVGLPDTGMVDQPVPPSGSGASGCGCALDGGAPEHSRWPLIALALALLAMRRRQRL